MKIVSSFLLISTFVASGLGQTNGSVSLANCPDALVSNQDPKYIRTFREQCFEFVLYQERYWDEAQKSCSTKGGHLVTIPDNETQSFLINTLNEMGAKNHGIWIGLNDRRTEGKFEWESGAELTYTYWVADTPPSHSLINVVDDCFNMRYSLDWRWDDYHCHLWPQHYAYICEYDMKNAEPKQPCPTHSLCDIDCSAHGYKMDAATKCPLCQCNELSAPPVVG